MRNFLMLLCVGLAMAVSPAATAGDGLTGNRALMAAADTRLEAVAGDAGAVALLAAAIRYSPIPDVAAPGKPGLLWTVQGYGCRACRRQCVVDFKIDCYESEGWCRRQFTRCMRHCWEDECR